MVNTRNSANRHLSRRKFRNHIQPTHWKSHNNTSAAKQPSAAPLLSGSGMINLQHLANHIFKVLEHAATCQQCSSIAGSSGEAITLVGEPHHSGLASVLTARCNACGTDIHISTSSQVATMSAG